MLTFFKFIIFVFLTAIAINLLSCGDSLNDSDSEKDKPSIVFGDNIEGVKIWDDSSAVIQKLGRPSAIGIGDFWGYWFEYKSGRLNYILVTVTNTPILGNGVINISVEAPYTGKSKEGIGIGSNRDYVLNKLGTPNSTYSDSTGIKDTYNYDYTYFSIDYADGKAERISMFVLVQ